MFDESTCMWGVLTLWGFEFDWICMFVICLQLQFALSVSCYHVFLLEECSCPTASPVTVSLPIIWDFVFLKDVLTRLVLRDREMRLAWDILRLYYCVGHMHDVSMLCFPRSVSFCVTWLPWLACDRTVEENYCHLFVYITVPFFSCRIALALRIVHDKFKRCTFVFLTYKVSDSSFQALSVPPQILGSHVYEHRSLCYFPSVIICQLLPQCRNGGHVTDWKYPGLLKQINSSRRSIKSRPQKCLESKPPSEPGWMLLRGQNKRPYFLQSPQTKSSLSSQHA